jgi:hypothetical protein
MCCRGPRTYRGSCPVAAAGRDNAASGSDVRNPTVAPILNQHRPSVQDRLVTTAGSVIRSRASPPPYRGRDGSPFTGARPAPPQQLGQLCRVQWQLGSRLLSLIGKLARSLD